MVVVGSRCQVRKSVSGLKVAPPADDGPWPRSAGPAARAAARLETDVPRNPRRSMAFMVRRLGTVAERSAALSLNRRTDPRSAGAIGIHGIFSAGSSRFLLVGLGEVLLERRHLIRQK